MYVKVPPITTHTCTPPCERTYNIKIWSGMFYELFLIRGQHYSIHQMLDIPIWHGIYKNLFSQYRNDHLPFLCPWFLIQLITCMLSSLNPCKCYQIWWELLCLHPQNNCFKDWSVEIMIWFSLCVACFLRLHPSERKWFRLHISFHYVSFGLKIYLPSGTVLSRIRP